MSQIKQQQTNKHAEKLLGDDVREWQADLLLYIL